MASQCPLAAEMNRRLHAERLVRGTHQRQLHKRRWHAIPTGAFVLLNGGPMLVLDDAVVPWTTERYGDVRQRPRAGRGDDHSPSSAAALAAGYRPQIDPAALR